MAVTIDALNSFHSYLTKMRTSTFASYWKRSKVFFKYDVLSSYIVLRVFSLHWMPSGPVKCIRAPAVLPVVVGMMTAYIVAQHPTRRPVVCVGVHDGLLFICMRCYCKAPSHGPRVYGDRRAMIRMISTFQCHMQPMSHASVDAPCPVLSAGLCEQYLRSMAENVKGSCVFIGVDSATIGVQSGNLFACAVAVPISASRALRDSDSSSFAFRRATMMRVHHLQQVGRRQPPDRDGYGLPDVSVPKPPPREANRRNNDQGHD